MSEAENEKRQNASLEAYNQHYQNQVWDDLQASLNDRLAEIPVCTAEEKWNAFKSIVYKVSKEKLSIAVRKHKDWFDGNSLEL